MSEPRKAKILIVEEHKLFQDLINHQLDSSLQGTVSIFGTYSDVEQAIGAIFMNEPDILILDLKLLGEQHFEVLERLLTKQINGTKILVAASVNQLSFVQRMVEIGLAGLLIKPVKPSDLNKALTRLIKPLNEMNGEKQHSDSFITLRSNHSKLYLKQSDILFIESQRNICNITLNDGSTKTVNDNIGSIQQRLMVKNLVRIDKSTIMNLSNLEYIDGSKYNNSVRLKLINGQNTTKNLSKAAIQRLYKMDLKSVKN